MPRARAEAPVAQAAAAPAAAAPVVRGGGVLGWVELVLIVLAAVLLAVVECFLVPLRFGSVPVPVSVPLAIAGNVALARMAARASGRVLTAVIPPVLWLAVVLVLAMQRAEGDLVVPGTLTGLVFLLGGTVAGAYGAASSITRWTRPPRPTRG